MVVFCISALYPQSLCYLTQHSHFSGQVDICIVLQYIAGNDEVGQFIQKTDQTMA